MGLSAVTYALAKKYTDETAIEFGGLKGAPCQVKSVQKDNGRTTITLEWKNSEGETRESYIYIDDGVSIWISGRDYKKDTLVVHNKTLYQCKVANNDDTFDPLKWDLVGDGSSREISWDNYQALSTEEKNNGTTYYIYDAPAGPSILYKSVPYVNGSGGTSDYSMLLNKPQINGTTLTKSTVASELDLVDDDTLEVKDNKIKIKNLPSIEDNTLLLTF